MTGKEIVDRIVPDWAMDGGRWLDVLANAIDTALALERSRCAELVWEHRGKCVSDASAKALMEEVRRE
jgi:hypothetical protein